MFNFASLKTMMNHRLIVILCLFTLLRSFRVYGAVVPDKIKAANGNDKQNIIPDVTNQSGFLSAVYIIILSELGDKTFFIAAILSANNPRAVVYAGTMLALILMTVLSSYLGYMINFVPVVYTTYLSAVLYLVFGLKIIYDAYYMKPEDSKEEYEEVQQNLSVPTGDKEDNVDSKFIAIKKYLRKFVHPVLLQSFVLCFIAEWGDRSQIATIILAATKSVYGVILGAALGHALCSGLAVLAGRLISYKVPVKWLTMIGGITFICFSLHSFYEASASHRHEYVKQIETVLNRP